MERKSVSFGMVLGLLLLGYSLVHVGCGARQVTRTVTHGSIGWESAHESPAVPGIDQAMLAWYLRGGRLTYVIWTDVKGGGGSRSGSGGGSSSA